MPLPSSSGIFFLRNHNTGKYAAVNGSSIVAAPTPFRHACQWKIVSAGAGQTLQNVGSGLYYAQGEMHSTFTGVTARSDPFVVFFEEDEADKNIFYVNFFIGNTSYHFSDTDHSVLYAASDAYPDTRWNQKTRTQWVLEPSTLPDTNATYQIRNHHTNKYAMATEENTILPATLVSEDPHYQWKFVSTVEGYYLKNVGSGRYYSKAELHTTFTGVTTTSDPFLIELEVEKGEGDKNIYYINFILDGISYHFTDTNQSVLYAVSDAYPDSRYNQKTRTQWVLESA